MNQQVKDMLQLRRWAVTGASANPDKFGYRIFTLLKRYGYEVYPVNPRESVIDGDPCYASLAALPVVPDAVDFVVPPAVALQGLEECAALGIKHVWLQPGVNKPEVVAKAKELNLNVIHEYCVMVESSKQAMLKEKSWVIFSGTEPDAAAETLADRLQSSGYSAIQAMPDMRLASPASAVALIAGPAAQTEQALRACKAAGLEYVWVQPGSETEELIDLALSLQLIIVHHASVLDELA